LPLPAPRTSLCWRDQRVEVVHRDLGHGAYELSVGDQTVKVEVRRVGAGGLWLEDGRGRLRRFHIERSGSALHVYQPSVDVSFEVEPRLPEARVQGREAGCTAPMPGTIVEVRVSPGDLVEAGQ